MEINDLNPELLKEISVQLNDALNQNEDDLDDLDFQLIIWEVMQSFGFAPHEIGHLIKQHGEILIGKVHAERLIGILE